jgi:aminopeptidase 2
MTAAHHSLCLLLGAMENWGLITGRTTSYLVDPTAMSLDSKKRIVDTQSHEVSHMW